jgi:CheY-like chemotaxis protein
MERIARETFPRAIRVGVQCPRDLWTVPGDTTQLHQMLMNLAVNARDAMPDGGILTLSAANLVIDTQFAGTGQDIRPGHYVLLQVSDTGEGIDPAIVDRVFEPFFTTKSVGQGTGLGLSTVHAIATGHGGSVQVSSEPRIGSTFKVYLPAEVTASPPAPTETFALPRGQGELVLVIDDENIIRAVTRQTLETYGYRVLTAADGAEGIALFAQQSAQISAVITDMMMPVMDGPATIHAMLHLKPHVRIIAASGLNNQTHVAKATRAGITDFLPKPYTAETLLTLLRAVLDRPNVG